MSTGKEEIHGLTKKDLKLKIFWKILLKEQGILKANYKF